MSLKIDAPVPFSGGIEEPLSRAFKASLLQMTPPELYDIVKRNLPFYAVTDHALLYELNLLFLIYGFLSYQLFASGVCKLILKGGKVLQQWHPIGSNDIDIMLAPVSMEKRDELSDAKFVSIGQEISDFILWIDSEKRFNWSGIAKIVPHDTKSIYKISRPNGFSWTAMSDIGIGYNHLEKGYVQPLYDEDCRIPAENINRIFDIIYFTLCPESFVKEKIYYVMLYYTKNAFLSSVHMTHPQVMEFQGNDMFINKALHQLAVSGIFEKKYENMFREIVREVSNLINSPIPVNHFMQLFKTAYLSQKTYIAEQLKEYTRSSRPRQGMKSNGSKAKGAKTRNKRKRK